MVTLFGCTQQNISLHIKNLIAEGEIRPAQRFKSRLNLCNADAKTMYYDFRAVCSVGMRVSSIVGRAFRNYIIDHLEHLARHGWTAEPWFLEEMRAQRPQKDAEPENKQDVASRFVNIGRPTSKTSILPWAVPFRAVSRITLASHS
jgi:hypothetical protein